MGKNLFHHRTLEKFSNFFSENAMARFYLINMLAVFVKSVADFGVCAAGKIWRWPAWPVGSFVAGSRFRGLLSKNRPFSGEKS